MARNQGVVFANSTKIIISCEWCGAKRETTLASIRRVKLCEPCQREKATRLKREASQRRWRRQKESAPPKEKPQVVETPRQVYYTIESDPLEVGGFKAGATFCATDVNAMLKLRSFTEGTLIRGAGRFRVEREGMVQVLKRVNT